MSTLPLTSTLPFVGWLASPVRVTESPLGSIWSRGIVTETFLPAMVAAVTGRGSGAAFAASLRSRTSMVAVAVEVCPAESWTV